MKHMIGLCVNSNPSILSINMCVEHALWARVALMNCLYTLFCMFFPSPLVISLFSADDFVSCYKLSFWEQKVEILWKLPSFWKTVFIESGEMGKAEHCQGHWERMLISQTRVGQGCWVCQLNDPNPFPWQHPWAMAGLKVYPETQVLDMDFSLSSVKIPGSQERYKAGRDHVR